MKSTSSPTLRFAAHTPTGRYEFGNQSEDCFQNCVLLLFAHDLCMGLEIGGHIDEPDWPKMGPSILVATCLIVAIRTAKWPSKWDKTASHTDLDSEIEYVHRLANRVFST